MTPLGKALREKYRTPEKAMEALGLDAALLKTEHQMSKAKPTRLAAGLLLRTASAVNPLLAMDAKIDYMPIFKDLNTKNFSADDVMKRLRTAVKGKLIAKDEEMGHVGSMLKKVEEAAPAEASLDESVSPEQHKAMEAAAHGQSNLNIPKKVGQEFADADKGKAFDEPAAKAAEFLRGKGLGEDDIKTACDMLFEKKVDPPPPDLTPGEKTGATAQDEDDDEEEKKRKEKEAEDRRRADDKRADDRRADDRRADDRRADDRRADDKRADDSMGKDEINEAIRLAVDENTKKVREAERAIRGAIVQVKPYIGEIAPTLAFDSATEVFRHAAKRLGIKNAATMHPDALLPVIEAQPRLGERPQSPRIAQDASDDEGSGDGLKSFKEMYGTDGARLLSTVDD